MFVALNQTKSNRQTCSITRKLKIKSSIWAYSKTLELDEQALPIALHTINSCIVTSVYRKKHGQIRLGHLMPETAHK